MNSVNKAGLIVCLLIAASFSNMITVVGQEQQGPPWFKIYAMIPDSVPVRMVWSGIICSEWKKIGIDVDAFYQDFNSMMTRARYIPREKAGYTYTQGGYDVLFQQSGFGGDLPNYKGFLHSESNEIWNYWFFSIPNPNPRTEEIDALIEAFESEPDVEERAEIAKQINGISHEDVIPIPIFETTSVYAIDPKLEGFDGPFATFSYFPYPERWVIPGADSAVAQSMVDPTTFSPLFTSAGIWDSIGFAPIFDQLVEFDSWETKSMKSMLAESWEVSPEGDTVILNLREGVKWHDGWEVNATDVKFTWDLYLNPQVGATDYYKVRSTLENATYAITGPYQLTVTWPELNIWIDSFLTAGNFILPWHILKDVPPEQLREHPFSTGIGSYEVEKPDGTKYMATGPIGSGPYKFTSWDSVARTLTLNKNENWWGDFGNIETYKVVTIESLDAAIAAMKTGEVDIIHELTGIAGKAHLLEPEWAKVMDFVSAFKQQVELNFQHPIIGTGVDTPLGQEDPSRAWEAGRYVRKAMSLCVPREEIVKELMNGFGRMPSQITGGGAAPYYDPDIPNYEYNLTKAKEFLRKAGYPVPVDTVEKEVLPTWTYAAIIGAVAVVVLSILYSLRVRKKQSA